MTSGLENCNMHVQTSQSVYTHTHTLQTGSCHWHDLGLIMISKKMQYLTALTLKLWVKRTMLHLEWHRKQELAQTKPAVGCLILLAGSIHVTQTFWNCSWAIGSSSCVDTVVSSLKTACYVWTIKVQWNFKKCCFSVSMSNPHPKILTWPVCKHSLRSPCHHNFLENKY